MQHVFGSNACKEKRKTFTVEILKVGGEANVIGNDDVVRKYDVES